MLEVAGIGYGQWVSNFGCMRGSNSDFSSAKPSSSVVGTLSSWWPHFLGDFGVVRGGCCAKLCKFGLEKRQFSHPSSHPSTRL